MKKILIILLITISVISLGASGSVAAFNPYRGACGGSNNDSALCKDSGNNTPNPVYGSGGILSKVINILSVVVGVVSVFVMVVAGLTYILSGGESTKTNTAKNMLLYAVIGLVVVAVAQILVVFVINNVKP